MKRIILLACTMFFCCNLFANDTLKFRISDPRRAEKDPNGRYLRMVISTPDSGFLVMDYNEMNLVSKGYYADSELQVKMYCHSFYKPDKGFAFEVKCFDAYGNLQLHAELNKNGDTIWRQTFKNDVVVSSKVYPVNEAERTIFFSMQKPAVFPGGGAGWHQYIISGLKYPDEARRKRIQGPVLLEFTVTKEGRITKAKVVESADPLLNPEAIRLINACPAWLPAEINGNKVNSTQRRSVVFKL